MFLAILRSFLYKHVFGDLAIISLLCPGHRNTGPQKIYSPADRQMTHWDGSITPRGVFPLINLSESLLNLARSRARSFRTP
jgi:hypothetical protein